MDARLETKTKTETDAAAGGSSVSSRSRKKLKTKASSSSEEPVTVSASSNTHSSAVTPFAVTGSVIAAAAAADSNTTVNTTTGSTNTTIIDTSSIGTSTIPNNNNNSNSINTNNLDNPYHYIVTTQATIVSELQKTRDVLQALKIEAREREATQTHHANAMEQRLLHDLHTVQTTVSRTVDTLAATIEPRYRQELTRKKQQVVQKPPNKNNTCNTDPSKSTCPWCGKQFKTHQGKNAHLQFCVAAKAKKVRHVDAGVVQAVAPVAAGVADEPQQPETTTTTINNLDGVVGSVGDDEDSIDVFRDDFELSTNLPSQTTIVYSV